MPNQPSDYKSFIKLLEQGDYFVVDTETTGLKRPAEIVDIAIVRCDGVLIFESLVKPILPIPHDAEVIHGISNDMVKDQRTWAEIRPIVIEILSSKTVIAYNATYDRNMFHLSDEANGLQHYSWSTQSAWHCAMLAFAERFGEYDDYHGNYRWKKLSEAASFYSCNPCESHRAANDALMTYDICQCMLAESVLDNDPRGVPFNNPTGK